MTVKKDGITEVDSSGGGGGAATIADGADVAEGSTADAAWSGIGAGTVIALLKAIAGGGSGPVSVSGTLTNNGDVLDINCSGKNTVTVWSPANAGGWDGTLLFRASNDGGVTFTSIQTIDPADNSARVVDSFQVPTRAYRFNVAGFDRFRLSVAFRSAGSIDILMQAVDADWEGFITGVQIVDSTRRLIIDVFGSIQTVLKDSTGTNHGVLANPIRNDPTGTTPQPVTVAALPLPVLAATEAKQDVGNTSLASIDAKLTNPLPVSVSSALPTGSNTLGSVKDLADVAYDGQTDLLSTDTGKPLTLTKDSRLRIESNNSELIGAIEILTSEIRDLRLVMQFANGINLH